MTRTSVRHDLSMAPEPEPVDRETLKADARTAVIAGSGLGLALLGMLFIPLGSVAGLALSWWAYRTGRKEYQQGRITAIGGMVVGAIGVAVLVVSLLPAG